MSMDLKFPKLGARTMDYDAMVWHLFWHPQLGGKRKRVFLRTLKRFAEQTVSLNCPGYQNDTERLAELANKVEELNEKLNDFLIRKNKGK